MTIDSRDLFDRLAEICGDIASANSDFYCSECLSTLDKLTDLCAELCGEEDARILSEIIESNLNDDEEV